MSSPTPIHLLHVEDNPGDARLVREMLAEEGSHDFDLVHVTTVGQAIAHLSGPARTDVVLLDLALPDESGLVTLERVLPEAGDAVVVVMTGDNDEALGISAVEAGAQDYLVKNHVDARLLRRAMRFALRRGTARRQLEDQSLKDDLTGLNNRRGFGVLAEERVRLARRQGHHCMLLFLDLDGMKAINDNFGHAEGNRALVETAEVLRNCLRQSDIIARFGGDEFGALCTGRGAADEAAVRERLATVLADVNAKPDRTYSLRISVGILGWGPGDGRPLEELLAEADQLMYEEKWQKPASVRRAG